MEPWTRRARAPKELLFGDTFGARARGEPQDIFHPEDAFQRKLTQGIGMNINFFLVKTCWLISCPEMSLHHLKLAIFQKCLNITWEVSFGFGCLLGEMASVPLNFPPLQPGKRAVVGPQRLQAPVAIDQWMCKKYEPRLRYHVGFEFHSLSSLFFMNSLRKNNMPRILFCENPASQRMCLRKSWGIRTLVCERSGSGLSQKMFHVCMSYWNIYIMYVYVMSLYYIWWQEITFFCEKLVFSKMLATSRSDWSQNGSWITSMLNPLFAKNQGLVLLKQLLVP